MTDAVHTKFRIQHFPEALEGHRFRYAMIKGGKTMNSSEGYPTFAHARRAVAGLWRGLVQDVLIASGVKNVRQSMAPTPPPVFTSDSYLSHSFKRVGRAKLKAVA